jgi:uncharacterized membrane protein YbhN (UPF0104 family)
MVQVGLVVVAVAVLPTPLQQYAPVAFAVVAVVVGAGWWLGRRRGLLAFVARDLRVLLRPAVSARLVVASCVSTAAHSAVFVVALHSVGADVGATLVVPLALTVLVGAAIPLNVAGWGPREGVTAAVFGLAGLSSADGLTVSVVFGVLSAVATVPGLVVLLADVVVRRRRVPEPEPEPRPLEAVRHG